MWERIWDSWRWTLIRIDHFGTTQWTIAFIALLLVGFLCMQGLGSRKAH